MTDQKCAVCGQRSATDHTASGLGPASFGICRPCGQRGAEPLEFWQMFLDDHGADAADTAMRKAACSWQDGDWIGWEEIDALHEGGGVESNAVGQLAFFNVFQAYPERAPDTDGRVRPAIEDNLTRALALPLQALDSAEVADFLDRLDLTGAARVLRGSQGFDVGMQGQAAPRAGDEVFLVSLAAEVEQRWTTGSRRRAEVPRFDAWLQAPGLLVVS